MTCCRAIHYRPRTSCWRHYTLPDWFQISARGFPIWPFSIGEVVYHRSGKPATGPLCATGSYVLSVALSLNYASFYHVHIRLQASAKSARPTIMENLRPMRPDHPGFDRGIHVRLMPTVHPLVDSVHHSVEFLIVWRRIRSGRWLGYSRKFALDRRKGYQDSDHRNSPSWKVRSLPLFLIGDHVLPDGTDAKLSLIMVQQHVPLRTECLGIPVLTALCIIDSQKILTGIRLMARQITFPFCLISSNISSNVHQGSDLRTYVQPEHYKTLDGVHGTNDHQVPPIWLTSQTIPLIGRILNGVVDTTILSVRLMMLGTFHCHWPWFHSCILDRGDIRLGWAR